MHGLKLIWDIGYQDVNYHSNSIHVINLVHAPTNDRHVYAIIIRKVKDLLNLPSNVQLIHTLREANVCTDFIIKHGANQDAT